MVVGPMTRTAAEFWSASLDAIVATLLAGGISADEIRSLIDDAIDRAEADR